MNGSILVSTHKKTVFPDDPFYTPIQLGKDEVNFDLGIKGDNTGDNISYKHRYYSDLSSVYWAWKNSQEDFVGCCHYRRYFVSKKKKNMGNPIFSYILDKEEVENLLSKAPIIVPAKRHYYIETIESHFKHTHTASDFDVLRETISEIRPEYSVAFEKVAHSTSAHLFNCYIMKKDYFDDFCSFVFPILFCVEKKIDFSSRSEFESRTCGYLAEFLLDTWLNKNQHHFVEKKIKVLGGEKILKKVFFLIGAKFFGRKYERSF